MEANSDLFIAPGFSLFEDSRVLRETGQIGKMLWYLEMLGIDLPKIPVGWLVLPLITQRGVDIPSGTCEVCSSTECNVENCEAQKRCLLDQVDNYPRGEYGWTHHNSNTFAGTVARACCDKIKVPGGSERAWGWSDTPYPEVPHIPVPLGRLPGNIADWIGIR